MKNVLQVLKDRGYREYRDSFIILYIKLCKILNKPYRETNESILDITHSIWKKLDDVEEMYNLIHNNDLNDNNEKQLNKKIWKLPNTYLEQLMFELL